MSTGISLNLGGKLFTPEGPVVMGILNITPDSFYAGSRTAASDAATRAEAMLADGASIIDIGGYSSRPGAEDVSPEEEMERLAPALDGIRERLPEAIISVDTFRADVARQCVERWGVQIVNDISGGNLDPAMWETVADLKAVYVLMHMRGIPSTMQSLTDYEDVTSDIIRDLAFKADVLHQTGVTDVIFDPGFGFAKTIDQNYELLGRLGEFRELGGAVLAGVSRKTMIWKELGITPDVALNGTTAVNMLALVNGADILRVHDVKAAAEAVGIFRAYSRNLPESRNEIRFYRPRNIDIASNTSRRK